jgi:hypothetical protein
LFITFHPSGLAQLVEAWAEEPMVPGLNLIQDFPYIVFAPLKLVVGPFY